MPPDARDPLHARREALAPWERALRPPRQRHGWLWLALTALLLFVAYRGVDLWWERQTTSPPPHAPAVTLPRGVDPAAPRSSGAVAAPEPPARAPTATVSKCVGRDGRTVGYGDGSCPTGARQQAMPLEPHLNLADGMTPEARAASLQRNREAAAARLQHELAVAQNVDHDVAANCHALNQQITHLDALARQPNSVTGLDRLRAERQAARDAQFRLGCQRVR